MSDILAIPLSGKWGSSLVALISPSKADLVVGVQWWVEKTGYVSGTIDRQQVRLHRYITSADPGLVVDHRNGDPLDNRDENLRVCTHAENQRNQRPQDGKTSRFKGVSWDSQRQRWHVHIKFNRRMLALGRYRDEEEAAMVYDRKAIELFGDFAWTNFDRAVLTKEPTK